MLYISILLSAWFVIWLMHAIHTKDVLQLFVAWLDDTYDDESEACEEDDSIDNLLEKSENHGVYHLNCKHCNFTWWSVEQNVNFCPNCGEKQHE